MTETMFLTEGAMSPIIARLSKPVWQMVQQLRGTQVYIQFGLREWILDAKQTSTCDFFQAELEKYTPAADIRINLTFPTEMIKSIEYVLLFRRSCHERECEMGYEHSELPTISTQINFELVVDFIVWYLRTCNGQRYNAPPVEHVFDTNLMTDLFKDQNYPREFATTFYDFFSQHRWDPCVPTLLECANYFGIAELYHTILVLAIFWNSPKTKSVFQLECLSRLECLKGIHD